MRLPHLFKIQTFIHFLLINISLPLTFYSIFLSLQFVGWEEVSRPNTRAEIVQAMRRIRVSAIKPSKNWI